MFKRRVSLEPKALDDKNWVEHTRPLENITPKFLTRGLMGATTTFRHRSESPVSRSPMVQQGQRPSTVLGHRSSTFQSATRRTSLAEKPLPSVASTETLSMPAQSHMSHIQPDSLSHNTILNAPAKRRKEIDAVFRKLNRYDVGTALADSRSRVNLDKRSNARPDSIVSQVFGPTRNVLESLWDRYRIGRDQRRAFSDAHFFPETRANYTALCVEISRLNGSTEQSNDILSLITLRETYLKNLSEMACDPALMGLPPSRVMGPPPTSANHSDFMANHKHTQRPSEAEQEHLVAKIFNTILLLRQATCEVLDSVYVLRGLLGDTVPFFWEGENYILKMQQDLAHLDGSFLHKILPKGMSFDANPMILMQEKSFQAQIKRAETKDAVQKLDMTAEERARVHLAEGEDFQAKTRTSQRQQYIAEILRKQSAHTQAEEKARRVSPNVYQYPPDVLRKPQPPLWERHGQYLANSLDPRALSQTKRWHDRLTLDDMRRFRMLTPPCLTGALQNSTVDTIHQTLRPSTTAASQSYTDLHRRELLIFGESQTLRRTSVRKKVRKGMLLLSAAYRGFKVMLKDKRRQDLIAMSMTRVHSAGTYDEPLTDADVEFREWVKTFAPQWYPDLDEAFRPIERTFDEEEVGTSEDEDGGFGNDM